MSKPNVWYLLARPNPNEKFGFTVDFDCITKFTGGQRFFSHLSEAKKAQQLARRDGVERVILERTCRLIKEGVA